jgi:uncharacterized protein (DUF2252 family)
VSNVQNRLNEPSATAAQGSNVKTPAAPTQQAQQPGSEAPDKRSQGRRVRKHCPRSIHALLDPAKREMDALALLRKSVQGRVPHLVALKYERMAASPFGYLRGAVPVMAYDLGRAPHTGLTVQLCGDAHVRNFGAYAGIDGSLVFDINDFDETIRGPFEWDVKRMATSILLAGREAGIKDRACKDAVSGLLRRYRKTIHYLASLPILETARYQVHRDTTADPLDAVFNKAERATPLHNLQALTELYSEPSTAFAQSVTTAGIHSEQEPAQAKSAEKTPAEEGSRTADDTDKAPATISARRFHNQPPVLVPLSSTEAAPILAALPSYARTLQPERRHFLAGYRAIEVAFKVVGTGSVGLRDYCIYMQGNGPDDPLFLQVKEEVPSAWSPYLRAPKSRVHHGKRVVDGQRAMQLQSDPFLGYTTIEGRDYLVRQLNDHKASIDPDTFNSEALAHYADLCGELLARGHARSAEAARVAGYIGKGSRFDAAIAEFATIYADQTERDWQQLVDSRRPKRAAAGKSASTVKKTAKSASVKSVESVKPAERSISSDAKKEKKEKKASKEK